MGKRKSPMIEAFHFKTDLPMKTAIDTAAKESGQSASRWIRGVIAEHLKSRTMPDDGSSRRPAKRPGRAPQGREAAAAPAQ